MGYLDPFTTTASCYFPVDWMKGKRTLSHWMMSGKIKQKWTFLLHSRKKIKAPWSYCLLKFKKKSFLWNLLFHALVNYLKNASECTILNVIENIFQGGSYTPTPFYHVAASNFNSACSIQSYWIPWIYISNTLTFLYQWKQMSWRKTVTLVE